MEWSGITTIKPAFKVDTMARYSWNAMQFIIAEYAYAGPFKEIILVPHNIPVSNSDERDKPLPSLLILLK